MAAKLTLANDNSNMLKPKLNPFLLARGISVTDYNVLQQKGKHSFCMWWTLRNVDGNLRCSFFLCSVIYFLTGSGNQHGRRTKCNSVASFTRGTYVYTYEMSEGNFTEWEATLGLVFYERQRLNKISWMWMFVFGGSKYNSRIFHSFRDVIITGEVLQILTYARHSWLLFSEGS